MILLIDNYDSFSYNLYQLIGEINPDIKVIRNDEMTIDEIEKLNPSHIILSPGPGKPSQAGICIEVVQKLKGKIPILGVCLGHQAICEAFGMKVTYAKKLMHGKTSRIQVKQTDIFSGMEEYMTVARYHSLAALRETLPEELEILAQVDDNEKEIMAVKHKEYEVFGVQFHPESILTPRGKSIVINFLGGTIMTEEVVKEKVIKEAIIKLTNKEDLSMHMAEQVMDEIMTGSASQTQLGAYLVALSMKGATIEEITASAKGMRKHATKLLHDQNVLEIVGTGGDKAGTFNISTTSALILAATGIQVAKHGNRAASSKCGSADVLETLGVKIDCSVEKSKEMLENINICFLFAQCYHSAMKHVAPVRKELSVPTIFNILGPLSNPLGASMQLMGVYDETLIEPLAEVLTNLGVKKGMVVRGDDGLDEISLTTTTRVCEIRNGWFKSYVLDPREYGFTLCSPADLVGGTPEENAKITLDILNGVKGPKRDAVVLNSAAALYIASDHLTLEAAIKVIEETIDSKKGLEKLQEFIAMSHS